MRSFDEMNQLFAEMDRTFDHFRRQWWNKFGSTAFDAAPLESGDHLETTPALESTTWPAAAAWGRPFAGRDAAVSLEEVGDEYVFVMDLPGFEREDVDLRFDDGRLFVSAHADREHAADADSTATRAMRTRHVSRQLPIPKDVVAEEITASYRNGVLEVHLPIVADQRDTGHRIDIE